MVMKKLLSFLFFGSIILSCGKTDLPKPIGTVFIDPNVPTNPTVPIIPADNKSVELKGPIFVNGLPLLKRADNSVNGISEYFYDEFKREVRITNNKSPISETRYKYNGDLTVEVNFTKNPDYVSPNPQFVLIADPQFFEYDTKNRVSARTSATSKFFYAYNDADNTVQESNKTFLETNPQIRLGSKYKFNSKGNLIEVTQTDQIDEYTYDDKIRPNSFNPSSNNTSPGGMSKSNVLTAKTTGGWFGNSFTAYKYTYNKYNLPVTSTNDKGDVITYTYYE